VADAVKREDSCVVPSGNLAGVSEEETRKNGLTYRTFSRDQLSTEILMGFPGFVHAVLIQGSCRTACTHYKGLTEQRDGDAPNSEIMTVIFQNKRSI
jgi:hypothetical protein